MFALDLFNNDYERRLNEGAVDNLEARRIDDLNMKLDDLVARARQAKTPEVKAALVKEFQKIKAERDSYYKIREAGIPGNVPADKIPGKDDLLKGKGRSYYEADQKKNLNLSKGVIPTEPLPEHGGGIGPKQHWQDLVEAPRLHVGDPIVVTAPNKFEGKTGEIAEFSPSGKFVVVNLYNHGEHSMHLSDVEYNQYAADQEDEDDWYDDGAEDTLEEQGNGQVAIKAADDAVVDTMDEATVNPQFINVQVTKILAGEARRMTNAPMAQLLSPLMQQYGLTLQQIDSMVPGGLRKAAGEYGIMMKEGYQDFNKVEPYEVCLAGKPVKTFDYYEDARRFHDNWKKKLYREGNKAKADRITLNPILKELAPTPERDDDDNVPDQILTLANRWWNATDDQPKITNVLRSLGWSIAQVESEDDAVQMQHNDGTTYFISADDFDPDVFEAQTDYQKRRQRERDVDAGRPVAKSRPSKMTDYQKKRAQDKKDMALGEDQDTSGVESAIIRRIMVSHTDLLQQFGPEKVMQAAEEVAYNVGDVDEIGTSDVSAYVHQVRQILGA